MRTVRSAAGRGPVLAVVGGVAAAALLAAACRPPCRPAYVPGLGEIMTLTQMRHVKLWLAGDAGNWPLAAYEVDELEEGFGDVVRFHPTHEGAARPLKELVPELTGPPLRALRTAVADRDHASFVAAYDALTGACNGCHEEAGFAFNVVGRPTSNPYPDQRFGPAP